MAHKVLIVDDDRAIAQLAGVWLRAAGYELEIAYDGEAGLAAARATSPDAILLDIRMPKMDGFEVHRELKKDERLAHVPVIFLSANAQETARQRALEGGAKQFISKPYESADLIGAVRRVIAQAPKPPIPV